MRRLTVLTVCLLLPILSGTVAQQRERLPPPPDEECRDPIAGDWKAHVFYEHVGQWYRFDLHIRRAGDDELRGSIHSEWWNGGPENEAAPACGRKHRRLAVRENATGSFDGQTVRFNATDWKSDASHPCGGPSNGYLLDNFSGDLEPERQEFQSLLNADAPEWKDVPTVFRRVACADPELPPDSAVAPPPFQPPEPSLGCSLW